MSKPWVAVERLVRRDWLERADTRAVFAALATGGAVVRAVGGCVRDSLLDRPVEDVDIATPESPDLATERLGRAGIKVVPTGLKHGTVTAVIDRRGFEITSLRRDVATDGRHATVAYTGDWQADAERRDLTLNALYCGADGEVFDPVGGLADLRAGRVRFVGDPDRRIAEDRLRMLRFFRFHARFGRGEPDGAGIEACRRAAPDLLKLSGERLRVETLKLLASPDPVPTLRAMRQAEVLEVLLPEADTFLGIDKLVAWERARGRCDPLLRLAALVRHRETRPLAARLKLSNAEASRLRHLTISPVGYSATAAPEAVRAGVYAVGKALYLDLVTLEEAIDPAFAAIRRVAEAFEPKPMPVGGADAKALGLSAGPTLGQALAELEAWWIGQDFQPDRAALLTKLAAIVRREAAS